MRLFLALIFASLGSIGAVIGAGGVLLAQARSRMIVPWLVSYATGTLLGGALLGMLPEALDEEDATTVSSAILGGLLVFFLLEKVVLWRHCHDEECQLHEASGELILLGNAVHNLMDGVVIGAGFATDTSLGITASIAVIAHEVPQEVGDFAILLNSGYTRTRAFVSDILSSLTTLPAALVAYLAFSEIESALPIILAIAAASFIYIALADLIPGLHRAPPLSSLPRQLGCILAGVGTIALVRAFTD
jgi:zinc and cadmium transporter